jgi:hypothetical protein
MNSKAARSPASHDNPGVVLQSVKCTCSWGVIARKSGGVGRGGDELKLAVISPERLAFPR